MEQSARPLDDSKAPKMLAEFTMCNQFRTLQQLDLFEQTFGARLPPGEWREEVYPGYLAPIVRRPPGGAPGSRESVFEDAEA